MCRADKVVVKLHVIDTGGNSILVQFCMLFRAYIYIENKIQNKLPTKSWVSWHWKAADWQDKTIWRKYSLWNTLTHVWGTLPIEIDRQRGYISIDSENTQIEGSTDLTSHAQMETPSNKTRFTCLPLWIERTVEQL